MTPMNWRSLQGRICVIGIIVGPWVLRSFVQDSPRLWEGVVANWFEQQLVATLTHVMLASRAVEAASAWGSNTSTGAALGIAMPFTVRRCVKRLQRAAHCPQLMASRATPNSDSCGAGGRWLRRG